jgi:eukaryotic-like serine/threonine-protein kinase
MVRVDRSPAFRDPHSIDGRRLVGCADMPACERCGTITEPGRFCPACGAVRQEPGPPRRTSDPALAHTRPGSEPAARPGSAPPFDASARAGVPGGSRLGAAPGVAGSDPAVAATVDVGATPAGSLVGCTVGDFVIDGVIGGGSFGKVYRGRQLGLDRPVAIKVPTHEIAMDPVQARRFAREARAAARIVHPGVVAIYAVGELDDGRPYLAMQLIDGEPLDRVLCDGPIPAPRALAIARNIASALSETHAAGVVHRDLKPTNIMWRRDRNGDDRITIVDFGVAVCKPGNADATRLTTGGLIGTPHYMSPEQAHGDQVDARTDLYALGCLLFELVTATTPFDGSGFEVLLAHLGRPPPRASERNPGVPEVVDRLITELMQKKPDDRPASADAVVAMLDDALDALRDPTGGAAPRPAGRAVGVPTPRDLASPIDPTGGAAPRPAGRAVGVPTPRDLASPIDMLRRGRSRRWLAIALGALALSGAGFAAYRLRGDSTANADTQEPARTAAGTLVSATGEALRMIPRDDGELIVRTVVPEVIRAGAATPFHIEIRTKLGSRLGAKQVVVTFEDPEHNATARTAAVHGKEAGHYTLRHTFKRAGLHVVRIFPSDTETVSTIELDVAP